MNNTKIDDFININSTLLKQNFHRKIIFIKNYYSYVFILLSYKSNCLWVFRLYFLNKKQLYQSEIKFIAVDLALMR